MSSRPRGFEQTAELQRKSDSKFNPELEAEVRTWMEAVVKEPFPAGSFHEALKDGVYLCKLMNVIQQPGIKPNHSTMAFKQMENIGKFLAGCDAFGVPKVDLFQTVDLYENQNIPQVISGILALAYKVRSKRPDLPTIGPKPVPELPPEFTEEDLRAAQQSGTHFGTPRNIH